MNRVSQPVNWQTNGWTTGICFPAEEATYINLRQGGRSKKLTADFHVVLRLLCGASILQRRLQSGLFQTSFLFQVLGLTLGNETENPYRIFVFLSLILGNGCHSTLHWPRLLPHSCFITLIFPRVFDKEGLSEMCNKYFTAITNEI
jgi:hypothetical protein